MTQNPTDEMIKTIAYLRSAAPIDPQMVLKQTSDLAANLQLDAAIELYTLLTQFEAVRKHAWMYLANIHLVRAEFDKAMIACQKSIEAGGDKEAYLQQVLSKTFLGLDDLNSAVKHAIIAQVLDPNDEGMRAYRIELLGFKNQFEEFIHSPQPEGKNRLFLSNLPWIGEAGPKFDLEEILGNWDGIITQPVFSADIGQLKTQHYIFLPYTHRVWGGESLNNRTILIYTDQGLGDNIWLLGHIKRLKEKYPSCRIVVAAYAILHPILKKCNYIDDVYYPVFELSQLAEADYFCGIFRLLQFLPFEWDGPYAPLFDGPKLPANNKKRIIVNWLCNEQNMRLMYRKLLDMDKLSALLHKYKDSADFFVCQKQSQEGRILDDIKKYDLPATFIPCGPMSDLFSYIQDCDLLLTNDTLHIHIAGACGKDAIVVLRKNMTLPFWGRVIDKVPYYDTVRIIRGTDKIPEIQL